MRSILSLVIAAVIAYFIPLYNGESSVAAANPKYASLVIDADSGRVLHAANANARRYPASLTKMMTLYLMFEALDSGRVSMHTKIPVSKKAAAMPQTNIGLKVGDKIKIRDAIKALIVRSANDVAVAVAEYFGKTEWGFALKMTNKARQLGMKSTVFRNASGLPDSRQYTTARDMAVLAAALKRHFPQYYHFFKAEKFTWRGRTYKTHNKVVQKLRGADGLKTGYIRASGFNLATSVQRNGRNLVAVVLGGKTAKRRDKHMIDLIERSFAKLDKELHIRQFAANAVPKPKLKPRTKALHLAANDNAAVKSSLPVKPAGYVVAGTDSDRNVKLGNAIKKSLPVVASSEVAVSAISNQSREFGIKQRNNAKKGQFQPVVAYQSNMHKQFRPRSGKNWGVQVGAFYHSKEALMAAVNATNVAREELLGSRIVISNAIESNGNMIHRARLANLDEEQARRACRALISRHESCFVFRIGSAGRSL